MKEYKILTQYLFPLMLQITVVALVAVLMSTNGIELGYGSAPGIVLIVLSGISSALWGILYQCRHNNKHLLDILKDFVHVKQSMISYLFVLIFLLLAFGGVILCKGFHLESIWLLILLFLKALVFGGIFRFSCSDC